MTDTAEHCTVYRHSGKLYRIQTQRNTVLHTDTAEHCTAYRHSGRLYRIQTLRNTVPHTDTAEDCTPLSCNKKKTLDSRTQLDEPVECASGGDPLFSYKIPHLLVFSLVRILCALRTESRKIINMFLMRDL